MNLPLHPACELFPKLSDQDLHELAENIRQNGLINPIVTLNGKVLDGRNRLAACKLAGVRPKFVKWEGTGSPLAWVVATNLVRRHLTASQRAVVAFDLLPMLELEAKERQRKSQGRGKKVASELATLTGSNNSTGKSSQIAAKITKTNSAYVEKVKSINKKAPEIISEIKSGRMTLNEGSRLSLVDTKLRKKVIAESHRHADQSVRRLMRRILTESASASPSRTETVTSNKKSGIEIWCGDCLELMRDRIGDESISVVTTSPPYNQGVPYSSYDDDLDEPAYLAWMDRVFGEIHRVLTPDGSLFLVISHAARKPWTAMRVAEVAGRRFQLQNQICWVKSITVDGQSQGHFNPITSKRFLNRLWEPIFHFTKTGTVELDRLAIGVRYSDQKNSGRTGSAIRCGGDVWFVPYETAHGAEDKFDHPAIFPPELAERCLRLAGIKSRMKVLDPFCGVNGMVAASKLGVNGIGIDLDPTYCKIAKKRLGKSEKSFRFS
jgi:site-specific DNA-methyltransferase (adenine-specific)